MKLHRFTSAGFARFVEFRNQLVVNPATEVPFEILEEPDLTEIAGRPVEVERRSFSNRLEAGVFLHQILKDADLDRPETDKSLWAWLTLFFFDQVCPPDGNGHRFAQGEERLVPMVDNYQRFYRHLLLGPFLIVRAHDDRPERAMALLCNPVRTPGEIVGQLAARKEQVTNRGLMEAATALYFDPAKKTFKYGAGGKGRRGSPRRLSDIINQFDLTWYLYGMNASEILRLLPKEFDRFKPSAASPL